MSYQLCSLRVEKIKKLDDFINIIFSPFDKDFCQKNYNKPICKYDSFGIIMLSHYGIFMNTEDFITYLISLIEKSKKEIESYCDNIETINTHKDLINRNTEFINKFKIILYA